MTDATVSSTGGDPRKRRYDARYAEAYDTRRFISPEGRFILRFERELFLEIVQSKDAQRILDIPVGSGRLAIPLATECKVVVGADISIDMLGTARKHAEEAGVRGIKWAQCSADRIPFADGTFDAVIVARLFQHVPTWMARPVISELSRVVRPGGVLIIQFRSAFFGVLLFFIRYYVTRGGGGIRNKCLFPDQVGRFFAGHRIVARLGYKFPGSGHLADIVGFRFVSRLNRIVARVPGIRWLCGYMTLVVEPRGAGVMES